MFDIIGIVSPFILAIPISMDLKQKFHPVWSFNKIVLGASKNIAALSATPKTMNLILNKVVLLRIAIQPHFFLFNLQPYPWGYP